MRLTPALPRGFRLHTVFAVIFLVVLLLPLSGMYFFRIYESELVRQTESELIAQGIFISTVYKDAYRHITPEPQDYGNAVTAITAPPQDDKYLPYPPQLDVRHADIFPPRPDPVTPVQPADAIAVAIGKKLSPVLQEAKMSTLASMRLLDPNGTIIAGTSETGMSLANVEEISTALTGRYISVIRQRISDEPRPALASISRGTEMRVFVAMPVIEKNRVIGAVYLSRSPRNVLKALYEERDSAIAAGLFVLAIAAAIAALLSYMIGRPLSALTRNAQQLMRGDFAGAKLPKTPISEIASLIDSFEKMSAGIHTRSEYIRSFAMHLAHEFKTPLTAIQGATELMRDHPSDMSMEQRQRFMDNITKDTERMKKLVSRLLELARADMLQAGSESADMEETCHLLQQKYAVKAQVQYHAHSCRAAIAPDILETVLSNLIDNSLQQGAKNIQLSVKAGAEVTLDVVDDGSGISTGNADKIFTPFFTTRRDTGGTGLGLVICKSLLKAHNGDIENIPAARGAHFRIMLPVAA